ncbi:MAG: hypothetical protein AB8B53_05390 [Flavobacteriales bacterium]
MNSILGLVLSIESFYYLSQAFLALIGAALLFSIYSNIKLRYLELIIEDDAHKRIDKGLLYLSGALFTWVLSGISGFVSGDYMVSAELETCLNLADHLFSILNNSFILLALFYFYYAPRFIYQNIKNIRIILAIIICVAIATVLLSINSSATSDESVNYTAIPDFLLSAFLSILLASSLVQTFLKRGFKAIAVISALVMVLMITSQLNEVFPRFLEENTNYLLRLVSKSSLIAIFLLLATSWVIRLSSTPLVKEMQLKFIDWSVIELSIPSKNILNERIDFQSRTTQFKNLLKLGVRRCYGTGNEASISVGKAGEISNQSYLNRIVNEINTSLALEEQLKLDRRDLFTFIGEGNYRLRILPEHISIHPALLSDFTQSAENKEYKDISTLDK